MAFFSTLSVILFLFASSQSWFTLSVEGKEKTIGIPGQREFDYFLLSHFWPGTICQDSKHCCPSNACCRSKARNEFTIHGLWTDYNDGTWPACCSGPKFDLKKVKPLRKGLKQYWPTLGCELSSNCHGGNGSFWAHEWEKHGTCAYSVFKDEYSYFLGTMNLYFKYNVTEILRKEGYVASNTEKYPLGGIVSALQNAMKATPQLVCRPNGVIEELRICFYKDFKPRDCVIGADWKTTSKTCSEYVSLPVHVPMI
ncbi:ribonuclease T2 [Ranunculus cassubicifolius]